MGGIETEDYQAWNYTKNGDFSVRSAYHLCMSQKRARSGRPESSSTVVDHKSWLCLWDTVAPGKVKTHMWRVIRNGIAVGSELQRRKIKPGAFCVACGREETIYHIFWCCYHSVKFWKIMHSEMGVPVAIPPESCSPQGALSRWLMSWFAEASDDERAVMVQGVYALWLARNNTREGQRVEEADAIARRVLKLMVEWQSIHGRRSKAGQTRTIERWKPPEEGWVKANIDGATAKTGDGGAGVVLRNHDGAYITSASYFLLGCNDPVKAELHTCRRAAILAEAHNIPRVFIETDCKEIVGKLSIKEKDLSPLGLIMEEVKRIMEAREEWKIAWVRRDVSGCSCFS